jgi:hypothetical protein
MAMRLLESFSGLKFLFLQNDEWDGFDIRSLKNHMPTLEHLGISFDPICRQFDWAWKAPPPHLSMLLKNAQRLEQLALAFPSIGVVAQWPYEVVNLDGYLVRHQRKSDGSIIPR